MAYDEKTCPRERCEWTSADGKCHWPGDNCPHKVVRDRVTEEAREKEAMVRANRLAHKREHIRAAEAYCNGKGRGLRKVGDRWRLDVYCGGLRYYAGTYDTIEKAMAAREQALRHKAEGDFEEWRDSIVRRSKRRGS